MGRFPKDRSPIKLELIFSIDGLPSGISEVVSSITPHDEISAGTDQDTNLKAFVRGAESVYQGLHIAYKKDENELYGVTMGANGYITQASFGHYSTGNAGIPGVQAAEHAVYDPPSQC